MTKNFVLESRIFFWDFENRDLMYFWQNFGYDISYSKYSYHLGYFIEYILWFTEIIISMIIYKTYIAEYYVGK